MVDLRVFRHRDLRHRLGVMTAMVGFVLFGSLMLLPVMLQTLLAYPSLQAGMAMAPRGLGSFVAMPLVGWLQPKVDPRKLVAAGLAWAAGRSSGSARSTSDAGYWDFFWPQFLQGFALGLLFVPLTTVTMAGVAAGGDRQCLERCSTCAQPGRKHRHCRHLHAADARSRRASRHACESRELVRP